MDGRSSQATSFLTRPRPNAGIGSDIRMAQRQLDESEVFIHNRGGQQFLVWQTRMG
jgi:hypothetical protein